MQQININELKPHPRNDEFFDDMSNNVKILLSRIDNESDFKETFENNSKSSKNK